MCVLLIRKEMNRTQLPEKWLASLIGARCVARRAAEDDKTLLVDDAIVYAKRSTIWWLRNWVEISLRR